MRMPALIATMVRIQQTLAAEHVHTMAESIEICLPIQTQVLPRTIETMATTHAVVSIQ